MFIVENTFKARKVITILLVIFILINIVAGFHAYRFTHFSDSNKPNTIDSNNLSFTEKLDIIENFGYPMLKNLLTVTENKSNPYKFLYHYCFCVSSLFDCLSVSILQYTHQVS